MFHFLNLRKPSGMSSRDALNVVQRLLGKSHKLGHAGTLDPLAEGVLVCCLGQATRLVEQVQALPKKYRGTFLLGRESDTEDSTGLVTELANAPQPTREQVAAALPQFIGRTLQRPPDFSAKKQAGQRAYRRARQGLPVSLEPKAIVVHTLQLVRYEYPEMELDIECGSGVYVRSLGRDLAHALGTGAVMSQLVRTAVGPFTLESAVALEDLTSESLPQFLLPASMALAQLPVRLLEATEYTRLKQGLDIPTDSAEPAIAPAGPPTGENAAGLTWIPAHADPQPFVVGVLDSAVAALLEMRTSGRLAPAKVFPLEG